MLKTLTAAAALAVAVSGAASAKTTYNITFDGYCDGESVYIYKNLYVTGEATGCSSGDLLQGLVSTARGGFSGYVVTGNQGAPPNLYTYAIYTNKPVWKLYTSDGVNYELINEGTYSMGDVPKANAALPPSTKH